MHGRVNRQKVETHTKHLFLDSVKSCWSTKVLTQAGQSCQALLAPLTISQRFEMSIYKDLRVFKISCINCFQHMDIDTLVTCLPWNKGHWWVLQTGLGVPGVITGCTCFTWDGSQTYFQPAALFPSGCRTPGCYGSSSVASTASPLCPLHLRMQ